jgi:hypothetical protein
MMAAPRGNGYLVSDTLVVREVIPGLPVWDNLDKLIAVGDVVLRVENQDLTQMPYDTAMQCLRRVCTAAARSQAPVALLLRRASPEARSALDCRPIFPVGGERGS